MGINKQILRLIQTVRTEIIKKIILIVLLSATYIVRAIAMAQTMNIIFASGPSEHIIMFIMLAAVMVLAGTGLTYALECLNAQIGIAFKTKMRELLYSKIVDLGPGYIMDQRSGKLQSILMEAVENLEPYLIVFFPQIGAVAVIGTVLGVFSFLLDPVVGAIMILTMIICVIIPYITYPLVRRSYIGYWNEYAFLNAQYIDTIQGVSTLKAFNSSMAKGKELEKNARHFQQTQLRNTFFSVMDSGIMLFLTSVISYISLGVAAYRTNLGLLSGSLVPLFLFLTSECARPMMDLNKAWHSSMMGISASGSILELLDEKETLKKAEKPGCIGLEGDTAEIEFDHVTFRYPKGKKTALKNVSLKISAGQTVAIVGSSGSGKSTLANLLYRFYDIQEGTIRINGTDIREFELSYLRKHISMVFQENYLMSGSIADNIRLANSKATPEMVREAARMAGAEEFITSFEQGFDTLIGERGTNLSGGQRQRIAIARALMKKAPIRIFDEATSNVDATSELKIKEAIDRLSGSTTSIVIAHRLSTVRDADIIFVFDEDHLEESGTHEELLEKKGRYYALIQSQRKGGEA